MSEQLRVRIAEWCGWTGIHECSCKMQSRGTSPDGKQGHIPDYTGDLNAIASAEAKLSERQFSDYLAHLSDVAISAGNLRVTCATALQRATALARVINQERE